MQVQRIDNMFNFTYVKSSTEIIGKAALKIKEIQSKTHEREARVAKLRTEYQITDAVLIDILAKAREQSKNGIQMSYSNTVSDDDGEQQEITIGAGAVNMLFTERDFIDGERSQVERLMMIIRNLKDHRKFAPDGKEYAHGHELNSAELKFLGF
jgi:hypothetical protein